MLAASRLAGGVAQGSEPELIGLETGIAHGHGPSVRMWEYSGQKSSRCRFAASPVAVPPA